MSEFDIDFLWNCSELVKTVNIYSTIVTSTDERGEDQTDTLVGSTTCVVLSAEGNNDWQTRGQVVDHDFDVWFKDSDTYITSLIDGNKVEIDSIKYMIRAVTINPGHYEVAVKRE